MKASELTPGHIGKVVTVTSGLTSIKGVLYGIEATLECFEEWTLGEVSPQRYIGTKYLMLEVGGYKISDCMDFDVEVDTP